MTPLRFRPSTPDSPMRIRAIETALAQAGMSSLTRTAAPAATNDELELVHDRAHVEAVRDLCQSGGGRIDDATFVGGASYDAARHAAGGDGKRARGWSGRDRVLRAATGRPPRRP